MMTKQTLSCCFPQCESDWWRPRHDSVQESLRFSGELLFEVWLTWSTRNIVSQLLRKSFAARNVSVQKVIVKHKSQLQSLCVLKTKDRSFKKSGRYQKRLAVWERRDEAPLLLAMSAISTPLSFPNLGWNRLELSWPMYRRTGRSIYNLTCPSLMRIVLFVQYYHKFIAD